MKQFGNLFQNPQFVKLWLAGAISGIGDYFNTLALVKILATDPAHLGTYMSLIMLAKMVPAVLLGPLAGVLADRFSRKAIMVLSDVLRAALVTGLVFVNSPAAILSLVFAAAIVSVFFSPASGAVLPGIVGSDNLVTAGSLQVITGRLSMLLGNALGAAVLMLVGPHNVFVIDAASFVVSALLIAAIPLGRSAVATQTVDGKAGGSGFSMIADLREFGAFMKASPTIRHLLTTFGIAALGDGALNVLLIPFFTVGLRLAVEKMGFVMAAFGASCMLGALIIGAIGKRIHWRHLLTGGGIYVWATGSAAIGANHVLYSSLFLILLGLGSGMINVGAQAAVGTLVPDQIRGRVFGMWGMVQNLLLVTGTLAAGALSDTFGPNPVMLGFTLFYLLTGIYSHFAFRSVETVPVPSVADRSV